MGTHLIEIERNSLEKRKDGYPFVENLKKKFITSQINGCTTQVINLLGKISY
jgi:hypothetical protein